MTPSPQRAGATQGEGVARDEVGELRWALRRGEWQHLGSPLLTFLLMTDPGEWWSATWTGAWCILTSRLVRRVEKTIEPDGLSRCLGQPDPVVVEMRVAYWDYYRGYCTPRVAVQRMLAVLTGRRWWRVRRNLRVLERWAP